MFSVLKGTYKNLFQLLPRPILKRFWVMQLLISLTSVVDVFGLASFIPVISAVANPELLSSNRFFVATKDFTNIQDNNYFLLFLFSAALVFFMLRSVFVVFSQHSQNKFVFYVSEYIGEKTFSYYMNMDFQKFQKIDSATMVRELTVSPSHFSRFLMMPLLLINSELVMMGLIVLGIAMYNFSVFVLLCITIFPVAFIFQKAVKKKVTFYGEEQNRQTPILYNNSNRGIFGYTDAKLLNKETTLIRDYMSVLKKLNKINTGSSTLNIIPAKLFELVTFIGLFVIFLYAVFYSRHVETIIPLIAIYAAAGYRMIPSLSKLVPGFMQLEQFSYLFKTYNEPLNNKQENKFTSLHQDKITFQKSISLNDISFRFQGEENFLFKNLSLSITKGETIGIIGKSGSGKTTLVKILIGFLRPTSGSIKADDKEINETNVRGWMSNISYVQQSPYIEQGTLASNIAFLETEIDENKLKKCIEMASLSDFVKGRNPSEIEISEGGKNLSGGQKQRVCIARALYNNSQLLIFDEATSALDNETEREVTDAIKELKGSGVTVVVIAHRYSTLKYCDRIINVENGRFKETSFELINSANED